MDRSARKRIFFSILLLAAGLVFPLSAQSYKETAKSLYNQKKFREAVQVLERHLLQEPGDFPARLFLGLCYQQASDYHAAEVVFQAAAGERTRDSLARFRLARVQYLLGKFAQAETNARAALKLGGSPAYVHNLIGLVLEEKHSYEEALDAYAAAVRDQGREYSEPYINAGILLLKLGRAGPAAERLSKAIELDARSSEALYHRARARLEMNKTQEAERDLAAAAALSSEPARRLLQRLQSVRAAASLREASPVLQPAPIQFRNVAKNAGINFVLENHPTPDKYIIETMPGGVASFDYNGDGLTDIYFTNGAAIPSLAKTSPKYYNRLYRNLGGMKFVDVTVETGLIGAGYSMGVAAADYDNDGHVDLFLSGVNRNLLFRNTGTGRFDDVTGHAGLKSEAWSTAAGWLDYDNDGHLDLFVVNYLRWALSINPFCGDPAGPIRAYCDPSHFEGLPNTLYRNRGDGTFEDVSRKSGIAAHVSKGMSVALADMNLDGFTDIFVTNDTLPNFLFRNRGDGTFEEIGLAAGVGVTEHGKAISSMGADFRDYDNDGLPDLAVTALARETFPLFLNLGNGFFRDYTYPSRLGFLTVTRSGWSNGLFDFNNDGWKDLFTANSHVMDNVELFRPDPYRQANSVFVNQGDGTFRDISQGAGHEFQQPGAHRGSAVADFNNDGKPDVVVSRLGEPAELWENISRGENHWIVLKLEGSRTNRDGIGARLRVMNQHNHMTTSVGYASSSHFGVHFGLGATKTIPLIEVFWHGGPVQQLNNVQADQVLHISQAAR